MIQGKRLIGIRPGLPPSPLVWLKVRDETSYSEGNAISSLRDFSGNGYEATAVAATRPVYRTNQLYGRPVARFDGVDDGMLIANLSLSAYSLYTVWKCQTDNGIIYEQSVDTNSNNGIYFYTGNLQTILNKKAAGTSSKRVAFGWNDSFWRVISHRFNGTHASHIMKVNDLTTTLADGTSGNPGLVVTTDGLYLFSRAVASLFTPGDLSELILWPTAFGDQQDSIIVGQLMADNRLTYATLMMDLDPSTFGLADNDPIGSAPDSSGFGVYTAATASGAARPTYKTAILNGLPVMRFDGSSDGLQVANMQLASWTIFTVMRTTTMTGMVYEQSADINSNPGLSLYTGNASTIGSHKTVPLDRTSARSSTTTWSDNAWRIVAHRYLDTNPTHELFINGTNISLTDDTGQNGGLQHVQDTLNIGSRNQASLFFNGDIARLRIYNSYLSDSQISGIFSELNSRYAVY